MEGLEGYKRGFLYEESTGLGVQIFVRINREFTDIDKRTIRHACDTIVNGLALETVALDPSEKIAAELEKREIISLFPSPIFVEEIPNGYCHQPCCSLKPWFIVTTPKGRIEIGWRKRVINIDWSGSAIQAKAEELFPEVESTKGDHYIHAWGYEEAAKYINRLME